MPVVRTYLELTAPGALRPARPVPAEIRRVEGDPAFGARMYREVGAPYAWTDRLGWDDAAWAEWDARVETWGLWADGAVAGYGQLRPDGEGGVEVAYFGLLEPFHGRGLGGHFLTVLLRRALAAGGRVWLHTCTLDGPHALANYRARGLVAYREEVLSA